MKYQLIVTADYSSILNLSSSTNETIQFTADSTFTGSLGDSNVSVDFGATLSISDDILGNTSVSGAGNIIVEVNSNSSQDFANLSLSGSETILFTANSTFTGDFQNSSVIIDTGVSVTTDASRVVGKTLSGSGTLNVTNLDATLNADFSSITTNTINVDFSGTGTYTGNLTNVSTLTVSSGTMSVDASTISAVTTTNNSTINITNLDNQLSMDLTTINGSGTINTDFSGTGTFIGNLDNSNLTVSSGTMTLGSAATISSASSIVVNGTMVGDASKVLTSSISGSGTLNVTNLDEKLNADFSSITTSTINADFSGTGTYTGNLTNVDSLTISSGTMTIDDSILGTLSTSGAGNIIVEVNSNSSQDFANLSLSGSETILFTANSTFTGDFQNSSVIIDTGVSVTTDASRVVGKTLSGSGTLNVTNLDATLNADFSSITTNTINVDFSGTGTYTGNLTNVSTLTVSSGTMSVDASTISAVTTTNNSTINITNLDNQLSMDLTTINGSGTINTDFSGTGTFIGNLDNSNLTVSSGTMTLGSAATISSASSIVVNGTMVGDASKYLHQV